MGDPLAPQPSQGSAASDIDAERVIFWRAVGSEDSFFPGDYYALCITNRRILLLNLGSGLLWFLFLGPLGYGLGKKSAQGMADVLRAYPPSAMLESYPNSRVIEASDLVDVGIDAGRLFIITKRGGRTQYRFPDLLPVHSRQLAEVLGMIQPSRPAIASAPPIAPKAVKNTPIRPRKVIELGPFSMDRVWRAAEKVRERLRRSTAALEAASIPYAVVGGNAVAAWVSRLDESAARVTPDVDILIRRPDFEKARSALESAGFVHELGRTMETFLDGPGGKEREALHLLFSGEPIRAGESILNPEPEPWEDAGGYRILPLEALVQTKLSAFRNKDQVHIQDLIGVGLIDDTWPERFPAVLAERLHTLLDDPEG